MDGQNCASTITQLYYSFIYLRSESQPCIALKKKNTLESKNCIMILQAESKPLAKAFQSSSFTSIR